jgi:4-hydroxybenzoyl-CoA thioesterase
MTPSVHIRELVVEWGHCDPAGIVFHPRYFEWFDACAAALFTQVSGLTKAEMLARYGAAGIPVVEAGAKFLAPCRYGDPVRVETRVSAFRRSAFDVRHLVSNGGAPAVEGWSTRVWTARDGEGRLRSQPLPAELLAQFGAAP